MTHNLVLLAAMLSVSLVLDALVRPRRATGRQWPGLLLHLLVITGFFGLGLTLSGNFPVATALSIAVMTLFAVASNAKHSVLGEPLIFSDLALVSFVVRHPRFYLSAISVRQRWIVAVMGAAAAIAFLLLFSWSPDGHVTGALLLLASLAILWLILGSRWAATLAPKPDLDGDVARYGLVATMALYWRRWRESPDPPHCPAIDAAGDDAPELIVVVQCESFADPVDIANGTADALPGLRAAREAAWQSGKLEVSGFGAYTMRTEYAVLFGRGEDALGFRRYDPFLTALGETSYALPARLKGAGYRSLFVHPYDMRFYGRDRLMPAIGFDRLIGEGGFTSAPRTTRYIDDRTLGRKLTELVRDASGPTLIYAVTMENHGPWDSDAAGGADSRLDAFLRHLRNSDAMLTDLIDGLKTAGKPALLVFFGDHRPSIPGIVTPGGERHTPYVMMRFDADGRPMTRDVRIALTPAMLHHTILGCVRRD